MGIVLGTIDYLLGQTSTLLLMHLVIRLFILYTNVMRVSEGLIRLLTILLAPGYVVDPLPGNGLRVLCYLSN